MTKKWMLLTLVVLTVWVLPLGLLDQPVQAQYGTEYACYNDDSRCQAIYGQGCPAGTRCGITAELWEGVYPGYPSATCCITAYDISCVPTHYCVWSINQCTYFCEHPEVP